MPRRRSTTRSSARAYRRRPSYRRRPVRRRASVARVYPRRPAPLGLTSLSKTIRKVPFLMAHIDPFLPVVRGVKVPDSNTMESDTALCTDEYSFTITTGTNVKCVAFNLLLRRRLFHRRKVLVHGLGQPHLLVVWTWHSWPISQLPVRLTVPCLTVFEFLLHLRLLLQLALSILQCMLQVHMVLLHGHTLQPCRRCAICRFTVR